MIRHCLTELIKFNHDGNFDRVMSLMVGMYHTRELYNAEIKGQYSKIDLHDKWFEAEL